MKKILYIDTETTGLDKNKHGMRELAFIVEIDGEEVEKRLFKINPLTYNKKIEIDQEALEISNKTLEEITGDEYTASKECFESFIEMLDNYIDKYDKEDNFTISGYNTRFDIGFLQEWFKDNDHEYYGSYFYHKELDTFALVKFLKYMDFIDTQNDKLETICKSYGIELDAHNALDDIKATKKLNELLTKRFLNDQEIQKQELYETRSECQSVLSEERLRLDGADRLAELEELIREWFIYSLMSNDEDNWFEINIGTLYKNKYLTIYNITNNQKEHIITATGTTTKEMFDKAFEFFKLGE